MATDLFASDPPTVQDMLACAERELRMRERVYPRWVAQKKMTDEEAGRELKNMTAIVQHFRELRDRGS